MKILVDGTPILREKSGVGFYTQRLLEAALAIDHVNEYTVYGLTYRLPNPLPVEAPNVRYRLARVVPRHVFNLLHREVRCAPPVDVLARTRPDLVFFTNFAVFPLLSKAKTVVVVYDVAFRHYPEYFTPRHRRFLFRFVPQALERASAIVTISEFTKLELQRLYGVDADRITVVPCAVDPARFRPLDSATIDAVRSKYGLPVGYVLSVGTLEPRKNQVRLLQAHGKLPEALRRSHPLVLVGGQGWQDTEILGALEQATRAGVPVMRLGYVAEEDLPALYGGASLLAFPSLYEGFGLPVLEAMGCGTPVVTSDRSSLPEVAGDAALLIDPTDVDALAGGLERLLSEPDLVASLVSRGQERVASYSWNASARRLLELFDTLVPA